MPRGTIDYVINEHSNHANISVVVDSSEATLAARLEVVVPLLALPTAADVPHRRIAAVRLQELAMPRRLVVELEYSELDPEELHSKDRRARRRHGCGV